MWWRTWQPYVVALCVGVIGFCAGRFAGKPAAAEIVTNTHDEVEAREVRDESRADESVTVTRWIPTPGAACDGGIAALPETITHKRSISDLTAATDFNRSSASLSTVKTETRPDWRAGALLGAQFVGDPAAKFAGPLVVGGLVERRIVGEVYVGAWGLSNASGGVAVTVGF